MALQPTPLEDRVGDLEQLIVTWQEVERSYRRIGAFFAFLGGLTLGLILANIILRCL